MRLSAVLTLALAGAGMIQGCGSDTSPSPGGSAGKPAQVASTPKVAANVLATCLGRPITIEDVKDFQQMLHSNEKVDTLEQGVRDLILRRVQLAEASRLGLDQVEVDANLLKTRRQFLVTNIVQNRLHEESKLTADEVEDLWEETKHRFKAPEEVRASHIFLQVLRTASDKEKEAVRQRAENLLEQLRAGLDFADAAQQYSEVSSASQGGDIGYFPRGKFNEPITDAAFALEVGQLSDVVESRHGFHILKCTGRRPERQQTYEEARLDFWKKVAARREREKEQQYVDAFLKEAWKNIDTEVHPEVLDDATTGDPSRLVLRVGEDRWTVEDFLKTTGVKDRVDQLTAEQLKEGLANFSGNVVGNAEAERRGWLLGDEGIRHELEYKRGRKILRRLREHWVVPEGTLRVSPEEIEQYYEDSRESFREPEMKRVRLILCKANMKVTDNPADKKYARDDALQRAEEVIKQYKAGIPFAELAAKYSGGFNPDKGGDQGFRPSWGLEPPLGRICDQPIGEISEPIWSMRKAGYVLGVVEEVRPERQQSLDEVRPRIVGTLMEGKRTRAYNDYLQGLVDAADVEIYRENFENVDFNIALLPVTWYE